MTRKKKENAIAVIPPAIPPTLMGPIGSVSSSLAQAVDTFVRPFMAAIGLERQPEQLTPEQRQTVNDFMDALEPEIEAKAKDMLRSEIRDRLIRRGDFELIERNLRKGRQPQVKRKHGCLFIQFGSGEADDPIEEFMVAST